MGLAELGFEMADKLVGIRMYPFPSTHAPLGLLLIELPIGIQYGLADLLASPLDPINALMVAPHLVAYPAAYYQGKSHSVILHAQGIDGISQGIISRESGWVMVVSLLANDGISDAPSLRDVRLDPELSAVRDQISEIRQARAKAISEGLLAVAHLIKAKEERRVFDYKKLTTLALNAATAITDEAKALEETVLAGYMTVEKIVLEDA